MADDPASTRLDELMDALGFVLRAYGKHAFDIDQATAAETLARCEKWARHLLVGAPHPDRPGEALAAGAQRGVRELRQYFGEQREAEQQFVKRLRDLVWELITAVREAFAKDAAEDERLRPKIDGLREAAASGAPLAELRERVLDTLAHVERALAARRERHDSEIRSMGARLRDIKTELAAARRSAELDPLTQLFNRAAFDGQLEASAQLAQFTGEAVSLLMIDVDHFKRINDSYGHQAGDAALRALADCVVRVASRKTDFVARYGGEEIAVVLGDTPHEGARRVAERLLEAVRKLIVPIGGGRELILTVSIGVASYGEGETVSGWLERADQALYDAKDAGRNRLVDSQRHPGGGQAAG